MEAALAKTQAIPFSIGSILAARYELRALLGEGGMGAVFRAYDRELDEDVALKVLHVEVSHDAAALTRFRREVKLARRVTHRNVARTFDLGAHEGARFLTMELIVGESLASSAKRARPSLPEVLRVAAEVARGLAAAHAASVVHRDLKPENVMLSDDRVVLTDFGIARVADGAADVMRTGMVVGTPAYMAPEQLENHEVDGRTDVYALGTMLFELLADRLPFAGETAISIAAQRLTTDAPDVRTLAPTVPDGVAAIVKEMLARRREDRPDAQAVLDRIEAIRGNSAYIERRGLRLPTLTSDTLASAGAPRTVAVEALAGAAETAELAPLLTSAIASALTETRVAQCVADPASADLIVRGTVRASADHVRARLSVVERKGTVAWAGHVDGSMAASLDFEDAVLDAVTSAVRSRTAVDPGPADPALRAPYEEAYLDFRRFALPHMRKAIATLEEIEARKPGDPRVRALLARALLSAWGQLGGRDRAMVARAEELALRALEVDPSLGTAHHTIAQIRLGDGELASAIRADEEALRHDPRNADAHSTLGWLMAEALHIEEGRRRLDFAARLDPHNTYVIYGRIHVLSMIPNERDRVRALIDELVARSGMLSAVVVLTRVAVWWRDHEMAVRAAEAIETAKAGAAWDSAALIMRSLVSGIAEPRGPEIFAQLTSKLVAPRRRVAMHEVAVDYYATMGETERSLEHLVALSKLPSTNLMWMDACDALQSVRSDPRFAEARATIAARCADLWGAVGTWSNA